MENLTYTIPYSATGWDGHEYLGQCISINECVTPTVAVFRTISGYERTVYLDTPCCEGCDQPVGKELCHNCFSDADRAELAVAS